MSSGLRLGADRDIGLTALDYSNLLRAALVRSHELIRERDPERLVAIVLQDTVELFGATVARFHPTPEVSSDGSEAITSAAADTGVIPASAVALPELAAEMERELLPRALEQGRALLSTHPLLDSELALLARQCEQAGITTQVLLVRAELKRFIGAVSVHWIGRPRPAGAEAVSVFAAYWRAAELALSGALEQARLGDAYRELEQTAFVDALTGLPNSNAFERELQAQSDTWPFSVVVFDLDGLKQANTAYGHRHGGDVLIRCVGERLAAIADAAEYPARIYTAGDEFGLLLPGQDKKAARRRRDELEELLAELPDLPTPLRPMYGGASVGYATRRADETPGQTLGRAIEAMHARKRERKA